MSASPAHSTASPVLPITRPCLDEQEVDAVRKVFESGWVTQGPTTGEFERAFARRHQVTHALATTSCTAALHMAVLALDLGPGDELIVPAFTWVTSAHCAEYAGARVAFCDIDPVTFNMDPAAVEAAVTPRTKAILAVHLFGLAADMQALQTIARKRGLRIIEDAACAVGSEYQGKPVGSLSDLACFSLHPRKVITTGEGGVVTTESNDLADRVAALRNHGANRRKTPAQPKPYQMGAFDFLGYNLRFSDIQAAIGLVQLNKLDALLAHRRLCAQRYADRLAELDWVRVPVEPAGYHHTYQSFVIWVEAGAPASRNQIMDQLSAHGIQSRPGTMAVHCTNYYRERYRLAAEQFPWAKAAEDQTITLPIFPGMSESDIDRVVTTLRSVERSASTLRKAG